MTQTVERMESPLTELGKTAGGAGWEGVNIRKVVFFFFFDKFEILLFIIIICFFLSSLTICSHEMLIRYSRGC